MDQRTYLCLAHTSETGRGQTYVREAFDANWVVSLGPNMNGFEKDLGEFVGEDKHVAVPSAGTAAVHLALLACGVKPGDEVLVQSSTFCASLHPIIYLGATPVFMESEMDTWNMDPVLLEGAIKDRVEKAGKTPRAIVPVALCGIPHKVDEIMAIADRYGIPVVEDAAEGSGSRYDGRMLGTLGRYGVLPFNGNKMVTISGGGALICLDREAKQEIMFHVTQAREAYPYHQYEQTRYNYQMSNICAGVGHGQMMVADAHVAYHKHTCDLYRELLKDVRGITLYENPSGRFGSSYWLNTIALDPLLGVKGQENAYQAAVQGAVGGAGGVAHVAVNTYTDCEPNANIEAMRVGLDVMDTESHPLWKSMYKQPTYKDCPAYVNGTGEFLLKIGLYLSFGPYVTDEDVAYTVDCIKKNICYNRGRIHSNIFIGKVSVKMISGHFYFQ